MFQLDESFLDEIGLKDLPEDQKKPFLQHIYDELEIRVGTRLSSGMNDEQLAEFESIIDRNDDVVTAWLEKYAPDYHNDEMFNRLKASVGSGTDDVSLKSEYAATKWLDVNRPDYRQVVASVLEELKKEVSANRDAILGNKSA